MALPTCPGCKQSVLDDDAELCPFCGTPMKGKPGAAARPAVQPKPAARPVTPGAAGPKPSPGVKPASPAAATGPRPTGVGKPASPAVGDDDDPFAVKPETIKAIPISLKQGGRFTDPIVCPMCEQAGFIPPQARGRDVKCANPKCMAPIFTAPKNLQPPQALQGPAEKSRRSNLPIIIGSVCLLAVVGGGVAYWQLSNKPKPKPNTPVAVTPTDDGPEFKPTTENIVGDVSPSQPPPEKQRSLKQALDAIGQGAMRGEGDRNQIVSCRLAAYAYAVSGNSAKANEYLTLLKNIGGATPHYQIEGVVELARQLIVQGKKTEAKGLMETALPLGASLPTQGKDGSDLAILLATGLAATGQLDAASQLIQRHTLTDPDGQQSAAECMARDLKTWDLDQALPGELVGGWSVPQRVAVTEQLVSLGLRDEARQWIGKGSTPRGRLECSLAFLETALLKTEPSKQQELCETILKETQGLPPAAVACLQLHAGTALLRGGNDAAGQKWITSAKEMLGKIATPAPLKFSDYPTFLQQKVPDFDELLIAAVASAEVAFHERRVAHVDEAMKWGRTSLAYLRGTSFSLEQLRGTKAEIERLGSDRFQKNLKNQLKLRTLDDARRKASEIQRELQSWMLIAERRHTLQLTIIWELADNRLSEAVDKEVHQLAENQDLSVRENYLKSGVEERSELLPPDSAELPLGAYLVHGFSPPARQAIWSKRTEIQTALRDGQEGQCGALFSSIAKAEDSEYWLTRLLNRTVREKKGASAYKVIRALSNETMRERLTRLISAQCVQTGQAAAAWENAESPTVPLTSRLNTELGLVEGLTLPTAPAPPHSQVIP